MDLYHVSATYIPSRQYRWLIFHLALGLFCPITQTAAEEPVVISSVKQFWNSQLPQNIPHQVKLEITVNYYDPHWNVLWAEADGLGFYVHSGTSPLPIKSGQRILLEGVLTPSKGIDVSKVKLTVLKQAHAWSEPIEAKGGLNDLNKIRDRWVTIEGHVDRQSDVDVNHVNYEITVEDRTVLVNLLLDTNAPVPQLKDTRVRLTGVFSAPVGAKSALSLWVPSHEFIENLGPIGNDPRFEHTPTPIENLLGAPESEMVTIAGDVVSQEPGRSITLRDQTGQIVVQNRQDVKVSLGHTITAIGYPYIRGTEAFLRNAYIRSSAPTKAPPSSDTPVFLRRLVSQIQTLSPEQAARGQPVRLTGMVTWVHPNTPFIYLQDATGGLRIDLTKVKPQKPNLYDYMTVDGETLRGDFTAEATASTFGIRGKFDLPAARLITLDHAMTGVEEGNWVELQGYVNAITSQSPWLELSVTTSSGEFAVRMPPEFPLNNVSGSIVRIKGICTAITNTAGLLTGIRIWVPEPECILEEIAAPRDRFALPESMISSLRRFHQLAQSTKQIRVTGRIIDQKAGHFIRLQNGNDVLTVLTADTHPYQLGDRVEAVGIAGRSAGHLVLRNGASRFIAAGPPPEPLTITNLSTTNESLYGRVIQVEGRLLEVTHNEDECLMFLQVDGKIVDAILEITSKNHTDIPVGSMLKLTGIYLIQYELNNPNEAIIRLRSENDIEIIARSPWWTVGRLLAAMGILLGVVLVVLGWVTALRRRVTRQTDQIRTQLGKEAFLQARHLDIVENASDFIYTLDLAGRFTSYNPAGERLTGHHADDMLNTHLRDHIAPEDVEQLVHLFKLDHEQDATASFQARFKHKDGRLLWTETSARVMRQQGEPTGFLAITRDIGQRKELEEQLRAARDTAEANTRSKSAFLANMSHEIRTPMNGVIGMNNLLLQTPLSDEQRDFAETIRNSAESLLVILNDILDFSKIEAGKLQFDSVDFELRQMVEETLELMASRASAKGLELASYLPLDLPNYVRGDPGRIRQVLLNLIGNAVKFTEKGEVILSVTLVKESAGDVQLRFDITDTGIGISPEAQATLFQPFTQADNSTTRKFGGTGLGLVISKQIIELMQGEVGVNSTPGQGANFWFTIKIEKQPFDLPREEPVKVTALNGLRTLIVDDSETNRKIIQRYTVAWGMVSEQAHGGPAALLALLAAARAGDPYPLVLLDYQMPEMDGIMLAHEIKKDPLLANTRMILLTSWDRRFSREELNACGIIRMLVKPIRQQDLLGALLRCIRIGQGTNNGLESRTTKPIDVNEPLPTTNAQALRILVAEDNIVNQRVSVRILKNMGYAADIAANGLEVLAAVKRQPYDVIFMDGQMPELDGYETTRRLRDDPAQRHLHIVAMTANAMHGDRERCLAAGMNDYISKPARPDDITAALERATTALKAKSPS